MLDALRSILSAWLLGALILSSYSPSALVGCAAAATSQSIPSSSPSARKVTLFQTLDASFIVLWLNWWVIALEFDAVPSDWDIHIACFGENTADLVRMFHAPGCSAVYNEQAVNYRRQIFFAKWLAITDAYK